MKKYCVLDLPICYSPVLEMYTTCSNTLLYLWSLILLCGDVESNPGPTNGNEADININIILTL